jgi:hypothetical protein
MDSVLTRPSAVAQAVGMDRSAASRLNPRTCALEPGRDHYRSIRSPKYRPVAHRLRRPAVRCCDASKGYQVPAPGPSCSEEDLLRCKDLLRKLIDVPANGELDPVRQRVVSNDDDTLEEASEVGVDRGPVAVLQAMSRELLDVLNEPRRSHTVSVSSPVLRSGLG